MDAIKKFLAPVHGLMYSTSWLIIFLAIPATALLILIVALKESLSFSDVAHVAGLMVLYEIIIAFCLSLTAKWLTGPEASAWWKFWRD